ncbi:piRNA biogenesis protein EXD1-like [Patiria miniata]|uniref:3'-5' exonuclease domain-containing protein n=1 Tax=Patiria miniata TaxID=46514 RepID=A0A913ZX79_PATMI|nr:piRNA biogenesis protein EXD1-like [Patiria miniata]
MTGRPDEASPLQSSPCCKSTTLASLTLYRCQRQSESARQSNISFSRPGSSSNSLRPSSKTLAPRALISHRSAGSVEKVDFEIVDQEDQIQPALTRIRDDIGETLSVNCEGEDLSRRGKLSLVCVASALGKYTFLFDIKTLGAKVFDEGMREILEDPGREKLMFDCRQDSDCLWHQYKVKLANVLDLQPIEVIFRELRARKPDRKRLVSGYMRCLQNYRGSAQARLIQLKTACRPLMANSGRVWMERPIQNKLLDLAALGIQGYYPLFRHMTCLGNNQARYASQKYVEFLREREVRLYDKYERNAYLPWRVIPRSGDASGVYSEETVCVGCKRSFPRSDFSSVTAGNQRCPVCLKVYYEN